MATLEWSWLGRVPYEDGLRVQHAIRDARLGGYPRDVLLLLEHPPTVTLGRRGTDADLRVSRDELAAQGVAVVSTDRGGLATYHGPGQLVGYPIIDLGERRIGTHDYVRRLAEGLAAFARRHSIDARWDEARPGLWVGDEKLLSVGIHVTRGVTTHGFALNVQTELAAFELIVPCGMAATRVTSLAARLGELFDLAAVAEEVASEVAGALGLEARHVRPDALPSAVAAVE